MKSFDSNLRQLATVCAIALLFFSAGYITPHPSAALAASPHPMPTGFKHDDVPGGGLGYSGATMVTHAKVTDPASLLNSEKNGWACAKNSHCELSFAFRTTLKSDEPPKPYSCAGEPSCFSFTGSHYTYEVQNPYTGTTTERVYDVQIAGMFTLRSRK